MPKKVKKKREIKRDDGTNEGWEEYYEYIYPDEQTSAPSKVGYEFVISIVFRDWDKKLPKHMMISLQLLFLFLGT